MPVVAPSEAAIARAAALLREGRLVGLPTETVYGLAGDATSDRAVAEIFAAKGRPKFNPLIVHAPDAEAAAALAEMPEIARRLAHRFWPGPLTLVLRRKADSPISLLISAGLPTLALRVPDHPVALAVLRAAGRPLAAPSANPSGRISATTAAHVAEGLGERVALVLDGGPCRIGIESTVLDVAGARPAILRPGAVAREEIEAEIGPVELARDGDADAPPSPGRLASHYAPERPLRMNADAARAGEALLGFGPTRGATLNLSPKGDVVEAAANLFAMLHALDAPPHRGIAVAPVPETGLGAAINDRLRRAAKR